MHQSSQERFLEIARMLSRTCDFIDFASCVHPQTTLGLLDLVLPLTNCAPEWFLTMSEDFAWWMVVSGGTNQWLGQRAGKVEEFLKADSKAFERLLKRVYLDSSHPRSDIDHCASELLWMIVLAYSLLSLLPELFMENSIYRSRRRSLLRFGANPCCEVYGQPLTLFIFGLQPRVPQRPWLLSLRDWFEDLSDAGIAIDLVAKHSFLSCCEQALKNIDRARDGPRSSYEENGDIEDGEAWYDGLRQFRDTDDLKSSLLEAYAECGIYPDESWFIKEEDKEPNVYELSASGVDFVPGAICNPSREVNMPQRRAGRIFTEE